AWRLGMRSASNARKRHKHHSDMRVMREDKMSARKSLTLVMAAAALIGFVSVAPAQDNYPNRPLELLIPFAAGGANDQVGRALAQRLEKELGQPVAPINRTGANGYVAAQEIVSGNP